MYLGERGEIIGEEHGFIGWIQRAAAEAKEMPRPEEAVVIGSDRKREREGRESDRARKRGGSGVDEKTSESTTNICETETRERT